MAAPGLNVAADGSADPAILRALGATWIRVVAIPRFDLRDYFARCRAAGLQILLVLARESGGDYARYRDLYGDLVDAVQVGNEPDLVSESSWTMSQVELAVLGRSVREIFPRPMTLVCAGLASGHPSWLDDVDLSWADAVAFHPYAKDAPNPDDEEDLPDITDLIPGYQRYGLPLWITEWGWWDEEPNRAAEEVRDVTRWATCTSDVDVFLYFCFSDAMVPPFGLLNADGSEKLAAMQFREQASRLIPTPEPGPQFVLGFAKWAGHDPDLIGEPLENEVGPVPGVSGQQTSHGFLLWTSVSGMVFKDTRDGTWHRQPPEAA